MLSKLIQQKVFIGDEVKFILKTGRDILGELVEIGQNHITVENNDGPATILTDMIGGWEVINKDKESLDKKQDYNNIFIQDEKISSDNKNLKNDKTFIKRTDSKDKTQPLESSSLISRENQSGKGENNGEHQKRIHIEAIKKLTEINAKYNIHLEVAELNIKIPAFSIPDNELKKFKNNVLVSWNRVKNKYEYAQKVNELNSEYGRIQDIVIELKGLIKICPESAFFKQHLAYLLSISGYNNDALEGRCFGNYENSNGNCWVDNKNRISGQTVWRFRPETAGRFAFGICIRFKS